MQHLVNVHCKPYLLYGADVINWTRSELASISVAFNTAMCKIYKVKFCFLDDIYKYTGQSDVADTIVSRHRNFLYSAQHSHNVVVKNLPLPCCGVYCVLLFFFWSFVHICILSISTVCFRRIKIFKKRRGPGRVSVI